MHSAAKSHFVEQQGFDRMERDAACRQFTALMLQPRMVGVAVAIGLILQSGWYFVLLSGLVWWGALVPARNPFDAIYNALIAGPRRTPRLGPAPAPRRFAQGMAATFLLAIGLALLAGATTLAWIIEGFLVVALLALLAGRLCVGSYIYHLLTGKRELANRTLPWSG